MERVLTRTFLRGKGDEHVGHGRQMMPLHTITFVVVVVEGQVVERCRRRDLHVAADVIDWTNAGIYGLSFSRARAEGDERCLYHRDSIG